MRLSPAFLNRLQIINVDDQLEEAYNENELDILIEKILKQECEKFEGFEILLDTLNMYFDRESYKKKFGIPKKEKFNISDLAIFIKSFFRIFSQYKNVYLTPEKNFSDLILFVIELLYFQIEQISIPKEIEEEFNKKNDEKIKEIKLFYFNDKIKKLLICMHCYYISRIPVCLVGPTGLGKTCFAKSFAELFSPRKKYNYYSFHMDTQIEDLYGNFIFSNNYFSSQIGPLYKSIKEGTIFIADEFNLADDYILLSTLTAIEAMEGEKIIYIPNMLKKLKCNLNFFFIACQNDLSTMGRKILPSHILRKFKTLDYPILNENDLKTNCLEILNKESMIVNRNNNNNEILARNLAKFMIVINEKNLLDLGKWSMRNIRKILKRISMYNKKKNDFDNVSDEAAVFLYVLGGVQKKKQKFVFEKIYPEFKSIFLNDDEESKKIDEIFRNIYQKEKAEFKIVENNNFKYLILNNYFGIKLKSDNILLLNNYKDHEIIKESLFYALLATNKEPLLICGPSGYKKFLAKIIKSNINQIDLYKETSIKQLLGQINVINKENAQKYLKNLINKIANFNTNFKDVINEFDNDIFLRKIKISYIKKIVENLFNFLHEINNIKEDEEQKNNFIYSFTTIFKIGFLLEKILLNQPVLLNNISNLSPQVLERFNDLFNFPSFLRIPEDHCQTIIGKNEEINNLDSNNFRILACSGIENFSNLSEAIKSRFSIIHTSSYDLTNKIFVIKTIFKKIFENNNVDNEDKESLNKKIEKFIENFEKFFKKKLNLSSLIKLTYIFKLIKNINQSNDPFEILSLAFYITFKSYDIDNNEIINYIQSIFKENEIKSFEEKNFDQFENMFKFNEDKKYLMSNITNLSIECVDKQNEEMKIAETNSFLKILSSIHTSIALKIPLIIKGETGIGKKTAVYYFASKIGYDVISFNFLSSTTVDDLLCKTNILDSNGKLNPNEKKTLFTELIEKNSENSKKIILLENLENISYDLWEVLMQVFDYDIENENENNELFYNKNTILLPNGEIIKKGKIILIGLYNSNLDINDINRNIPEKILNSSLIHIVNHLNDDDYELLINFYNRILSNEEKHNLKKKYKNLLEYKKKNQINEIFNLNHFVNFLKIKSLNDSNILKFNDLFYMIFLQQILNKKENVESEKNQIEEILDENFSKENFNIFFEYKNDTKKVKIIPYKKDNKEFIEIDSINKNLNNLYNINYLYTLTYDQRIAFLYFYFLNNINNKKIFVLQGPSFSGKTYLINIFAKFYQKKLVKIYLNNDHGLSVILGQISPNLYLKPEKQEKLKSFISYFKNEIPQIFENVLDDVDDEKKWTPNFLKEIHDNINVFLSENENFPKLNEFKLFLKEINEFTNNIDFEKDSAFLNALKNGDWILLDGIENTQAELFEKISSLNNNFPVLNLFEKNNDSYYFKNNNLKNFNINNNFRIFITYNPEGISDIKNKLSASFLSQCSFFSLRKIDHNIIDSSIYLYSNLYRNELHQNEQQIIKCIEFSFINKEMKIYSKNNKIFFAGNRSFSSSSLLFIILIREAFENVKNFRFYDLNKNILQITYSYSYLKNDFLDLIKKIKNNEINKNHENLVDAIQNNKNLLFNLIKSDINDYYNNFEKNLLSNYNNINVFDLFDYIYYYKYKKIADLFYKINTILNKLKENNNVFGYVFVLSNFLEELKNDKNIKPFNSYLKNYQINDNLPTKKEFNDLINIVNKFKLFYQIVLKYKNSNFLPFIYKTKENNNKIFFEISSIYEIKNWNLDLIFNIFEETIIIINLFPKIKDFISYNNIEKSYEINKNIFISSELYTTFFDMIINLLYKQTEIEINFFELNRTFDKLTNKKSEFFKIINSKNENDYIEKCNIDSFYSIKNEMNLMKNNLKKIKIIEKNIIKIIEYYQKIYENLVDLFDIRKFEKEKQKLLKEAEELSEKYKKIFINFVESLKLNQNSINFAKKQLKELKEQKELDEIEEKEKKIVVKELEKIILFNKDLIDDDKKEKLSFYYQIFMYVIEYNFFQEVTKNFNIKKYAELLKHMNLYEKNKIVELLNFSENSNDQNLNNYWAENIKKYFKEFLNNFDDNFSDANKNKIKNFIKKIKILLLYVFSQNDNKIELKKLKNFIEEENEIKNINLNFAFKIFKNYNNFNVEFPKFFPNEIADFFDNHFEILKSIPNYQFHFTKIYNNKYQEYEKYVIDIINMILDSNGMNKINNDSNKNLNDVVFKKIYDYNKEDNIKQFLQSVFKLLEFLKYNNENIFNQKLYLEIEDYKFFENDLKTDFNSNRISYFYSKNLRKLFFLLTNENTEKYFKKNVNKLREKNKNFQLFLFLLKIFSTNQIFIPDYKDENNELNKKFYLKINSNFKEKINNNFTNFVFTNLLSLLLNEDAMKNNINEYLKCFYFYIKNLYLYQKIKKIESFKKEFYLNFLNLILNDIINLSVLKKEDFLKRINDEKYKNSLFEISKSFNVEMDQKINNMNVILNDVNELINEKFQNIKNNIENNKNKNKTNGYFQDQKKKIQEFCTNYEKLCEKILNLNEHESEAFDIFKEINKIIFLKDLNKLFDKDNFIVIENKKKNNKNIIKIIYKEKILNIPKSNEFYKYNINIPNKIYLISGEKKFLFFKEFEKLENNNINNFIEQIKKILNLIENFIKKNSNDVSLAIELYKKLNLDVNILNNYKEFSNVFDFVNFYEDLKNKLKDLNRLFEYQKIFNEIGENLKRFEINNEINNNINKTGIENLFKNKNFNEIFKNLNVISFDKDKNLVLFNKEKFIEQIKIIKNGTNNKKEFKFYSLLNKKLKLKIDNFKIKSNNFNLMNKKNQFNLLFDIEHYKKMFSIKNEDPLNFNFFLNFRPNFEEQINYEEYEFNFDILYEQNENFIKLIECTIFVRIVPLIILIESNCLINENKISKFNINESVYFKLNFYEEDVYDMKNIHINFKINKKEENKIKYKIDSKNKNKLINVSFDKDFKDSENYLNLEMNFSILSLNFSFDLKALIIKNKTFKFVSYDNFNNSIDDIYYNIYCYENKHNFNIEFGIFIEDKNSHNLKINLPKSSKINFILNENNVAFNEYYNFSVEIILGEIDLELLNKNYLIEAVIDGHYSLFLKSKFFVDIEKFNFTRNENVKSLPFIFYDEVEEKNIFIEQEQFKNYESNELLLIYYPFGMKIIGNNQEIKYNLDKIRNLNKNEMFVFIDKNTNLINYQKIDNHVVNTKNFVYLFSTIKINKKYEFFPLSNDYDEINVDFNEIDYDESNLKIIDEKINELKNYFHNFDFSFVHIIDYFFDKKISNESKFDVIKNILGMDEFIFDENFEVIKNLILEFDSFLYNIIYYNFLIKLIEKFKTKIKNLFSFYFNENEKKHKIKEIFKHENLKNLILKDKNIKNEKNSYLISKIKNEIFIENQKNYNNFFKSKDFKEIKIENKSICKKNYNINKINNLINAKAFTEKINLYNEIIYICNNFIFFNLQESEFKNLLLTLIVQYEKSKNIYFSLLHPFIIEFHNILIKLLIILNIPFKIDQENLLAISSQIYSNNVDVQKLKENYDALLNDNMFKKIDKNINLNDIKFFSAKEKEYAVEVKAKKKMFLKIKIVDKVEEKKNDLDTLLQENDEIKNDKKNSNLNNLKNDNQKLSENENIQKIEVEKTDSIIKIIKTMEKKKNKN